jgi:hypothetical protein
MDKIVIKNEPKELLTVEQYISGLNEPHFAAAFINEFGIVSNPSLVGEYIRTEKDKFRIFPNASFNPLIYRGENKLYKDFIPGLHRIPADSIEHAIECIKKIAFIDLVKTSLYYTYLTSKDNFSVLGCSFDIDLEAIAQHYEFATNYLDFSTDMATSMFFAYTQCIEPGKYEPISDFINYSPVLYIGDLKKLFRETGGEAFKIIGIQPAKRPSVQRALAFEFNDVKSVLKSLFTKVELPKSHEMAIGIYEHFKRGEALFPKDDIYTEFSNRMREKYIVSEHIDLYCDKFGKDRDDIQNSLIKNGYEITGRKIVWSHNDYGFMNYEIQELLLPWMHQNLGYRGTSRAFHA